MTAGAHAHTLPDYFVLDREHPMLRAAEKGLYLARQMGITATIMPIMRLWHRVLAPHEQQPTSDDLDTLDRRYRALLARDLENVERGYYPRALLWDFPTTRYLKQLPRGVLEMPRIFFRRARKKHDDLPRIDHRDIYPEYYLRNFHWQTDGWFSEHSARLYDISVEALFLGTADVMRRMAIPPVVRATRALHDHPRILDVACGTGRFLGQLSRTLPDARLYGIDLSPYYVKEAQDKLRNIGGVSLVEENAESMPFKETSFDVVTSVFLFHELPKDARRNVMREMLRVLRPGGTLVICDSAQRSESADLHFFQECFPVLYHEPYYKSYLADDLGDALRELGFDVLSTEPHFFAKVVVAKKPQR